MATPHCGAVVQGGRSCNDPARPSSAAPPCAGVGNVLLVAAAIVFWSDPGSVSTIDFAQPARGVPAPVAPLLFIEELKTGTSAKVLVRDAAQTEWQVKGGPEARAEAFATRLVAAVGYYSDSVWFSAKGRIDSVPWPLGRASGFIQRDGTFTWASFERRSGDLKFLKDRQWKWGDSDSREEHGLRILVMLLSNWDNKDANNYVKGANTGFIETPRGTYAFVTDWGQSLGSWGRWFGRSNWDCEGYKRQTSQFVKGTRNGAVQFGYGGQHTSGFVDGIRIDDVRWLMNYLGQITDSQIRTGLLASGADRREEECFAGALRQRIETLRRITALR